MDADFPADTVKLEAEVVREKFPVAVPGAETEIVPNSPSFSPLIPALKYRVFGSPAPFWPNTMSHKPGLEITFALPS
jgi:hypothetical protein